MSALMYFSSAVTHTPLLLELARRLTNSLSSFEVMDGETDSDKISTSCYLAVLLGAAGYAAQQTIGV